jgi:CheY-like chemotaxis protein
MAKVLLVEDDNNLREIFELRLIAEGYQTVTAGNGEEALVVAMKEKPDLIIADVMMPKLSGFEMLETLRAAPEMAATKCIMMTALGQAEDRARGERLGVIKYLVKSQVTLEDFVKVVREVVSPDTATAGNASAPAAAPANSQLQTNQGSEQSMQPDNQTPAPADGGVTPTPNPINDSTGTPAVTPDQPSAAQEQNEVQDQINSFVSSTPADAAPAAPADGAAPAADATAAPDAPAADPAAPAPTADLGAGPSIPVSTAPEPAPEVKEEGAAPAPSNTL